jgi:hypothetical protein
MVRTSWKTYNAVHHSVRCLDCRHKFTLFTVIATVNVGCPLCRGVVTFVHNRRPVVIRFPSATATVSVAPSGIPVNPSPFKNGCNGHEEASNAPQSS